MSMNDQERSDLVAAVWAFVGIVGVSTVAALVLWGWL